MIKEGYSVKPNGRLKGQAYLLMILAASVILSMCKEITKPCNCVEEAPDAATVALDDDSFISTMRSEEEASITLTESDYDTTLWVEIKSEDDFVLDLKYASEDNFTKEIIYNCARCFLRPAAASRLEKVRQRVKQEKGWRVKLFDCYRPRPAQYKLWSLKPDATYVANPDKGSMHNRGVALDLSFVDHLGQDIDMGTAFDHFGRESRHTFTALPQEVLENRKYLKLVMEQAGFNSIKSEWWHYSINGTGSPLDEWEWACN